MKSFFLLVTLVAAVMGGFFVAAIRQAPAAPLRQCGVASWYGAESGRVTANGEHFPTGEPTAAHRTLPFGSHVRVTDMGTGRAVTVRLNDRGPAAWTRRIIDLSPAAAKAIGMTGLASVCLTVLR